LWTDPIPPCTSCSVPDGGLLPDGGAGGTTIINDDWEPGISLIKSGGTTRVGWYWWGTADAANNLASTYFSYQDNGGSVSTPTQLAKSAFPVGGSQTWQITGAPIDPFDYELVGASWNNGTFLSLWAGDPRAAVVPAWNGGFETGDFTGWTTTGIAESVTSVDAHTGNYSVLLGSTSPTNGDSNAWISFTPPLYATGISFWYKMSCPDTVTYDWAKAVLFDNTASTQSTILANTCTTNSWTQVSASLVANHSYTLKLTNHDDNYVGDPTYSMFDDIAFSSGGTQTIMSSLITW
jgi:hypothetical protein